MIIIRLIGGLGNQMFQYAAAYVAAKNVGTELKVDNLYYNDHSNRAHRFTYRPYALSLFTISGTLATPREIGKFVLPRIFNKYIFYSCFIDRIRMSFLNQIYHHIMLCRLFLKMHIYMGSFKNMII